MKSPKDKTSLHALHKRMSRMEAVYALSLAGFLLFTFSGPLAFQA